MRLERALACSGELGSVGSGQMEKATAESRVKLCAEFRPSPEALPLSSLQVSARASARL